MLAVNSLILALSTGLIITFSMLGLIIVSGLTLFCIYISINLWFKALFSGAHVSIARLFAMRLRKTDSRKVIETYIAAKKTGIELTLSELEAHLIAGGNIENLVKAMVTARSANLGLSIKTAKAIDLAGRELVTSIQEAIVPKVIETGEIKAISKDGMELKVFANATLKCNIHRLIGGADDRTTMARIIEGISTTIGNAKTYKVVVENPDLVSETVENMGLDAATAYEIISIDILSVNVEKNIATKFDVEKAATEAALAKAKSDEQIAGLSVVEQQNKVKIQEMRAKILEAEAEIPKALASALASGKLGALDYYDIQNLQPKVEKPHFGQRLPMPTDMPEFSPRTRHEPGTPLRIIRPKGGVPLDF